MGVLFISHSSQNNDEAVELRDWLRNEGYAETFLDLDPEHGLAPGQRWEEELQKAGERCSGIVILISPEWAESKWCFHEFKFAKALGKKIFPVLIKPTTFDELPRELHSHYQLANISTPDKKQDGLNRLRIGLRRAGLDPKSFTWPPEDEPDRAPYRGLQALSEKDAAVFFGRDAQITAGLDKLRQIRSGTTKRILTIAAASGAGKSSFLKAGLLSRLERDTENFLVLPTVRPERDALSGENGALRALGLEHPPENESALKEILSSLQTRVIEHLNTLAVVAGETNDLPPPTLLLPIDQAEELFSSDNISGADTIDLLKRCLAIKPDLVLILTIRSDSLGALQADADIASQLELFNLPALPPAAFKDVIEGPAALAEPPIIIEPALTIRLIRDLNRSDALPLLAFTLERLSEEYADDHLLELHEYTDGLGGVSGAISAAVNSAYKKAAIRDGFPNKEVELDALARRAFLPWLVELDSINAMPKRKVVELSNLPKETHGLVQLFAAERLLVIDQSKDNEKTVQVCHEAVLRAWEKLASWIDDERSVLVEMHRLISAAHEWGGDSGSGADFNPDSLLHRGDRLLECEAMLHRQDLKAALTGAPQHYINACRQLEDQMSSAFAARKYFEEANLTPEELIDSRERASDERRKVTSDTWGPTGTENLTEADKIEDREIQFRNKVISKNAKWHPAPPKSEHCFTYNDDYIQSVFPCCGLQLRLTEVPSQHRGDGCCDEGSIPIDYVKLLVPDLDERLEEDNRYVLMHGMRRESYWRHVDTLTYDEIIQHQKESSRNQEYLRREIWETEHPKLARFRRFISKSSKTAIRFTQLMFYILAVLVGLAAVYVYTSAYLHNAFCGEMSSDLMCRITSYSASLVN